MVHWCVRARTLLSDFGGYGSMYLCLHTHAALEDILCATALANKHAHRPARSLTSGRSRCLIQRVLPHWSFITCHGHPLCTLRLRFKREVVKIAAHGEDREEVYLSGAQHARAKASMASTAQAFVPFTQVGLQLLKSRQAQGSRDTLNDSG
jgi:hypothetical protein